MDYSWSSIIIMYVSIQENILELNVLIDLNL